MAATDQTTISARPQLTTPAAGDLLVIDDASANETKHIRFDDLGGRYMTIESKSSDFNAAEGIDLYLCDATSGAITVTLPASPTDGTVLRAKKIDASGNAVTIDGDAGDTIDGATTKALSSQYDTATIAFDGTEWWIV